RPGEGARAPPPREPGPPPPAERETSPAQKRPAQEADTRRPRGEDRAQSGRGALSLWGDVTFRRLRLLRARVLGVRTARGRSPAQLIRACRRGPTGSHRAAQARRPPVLLRERPRRALYRPRPDGARPARR